MRPPERVFWLFSSRCCCFFGRLFPFLFGSSRIELFQPHFQLFFDVCVCVCVPRLLASLVYKMEGGESESVKHTHTHTHTHLHTSSHELFPQLACRLGWVGVEMNEASGTVMIQRIVPCAHVSLL